MDSPLSRDQATNQMVHTVNSASPGTDFNPEDPGSSLGGNAAGIPVGHDGNRVDINESKAWYVDGFLGLLVTLLLIAGGVAILLLWALPHESGALIGVSLVLFAIASVLASGLTIIVPGKPQIVMFLGRYCGTIRRTGLVMTIPFTLRTSISVRVNNFETNELKVNDADGNPINIAAIVVWQVADTAQANFCVEDYRSFVAVQAESALRHVANTHPYDNAEPGQETLRGATEIVSRELAEEVASRIEMAGLEVLEARISSLAYAPEIAQAMLQRQQAVAVIAAREKIVEGAVSMVQDALSHLETAGIVELDSERRANMVSNLLVVLCSDASTQPVINAGSLY